MDFRNRIATVEAVERQLTRTRGTQSGGIRKIQKEKEVKV